MLPFFRFGVIRISGSMLNLRLRQDNCVSTAGLFREKVGMMEKPFVVNEKLAEKYVTGLLVSICCAYPLRDNAQDRTAICMRVIGCFVWQISQIHRVREYMNSRFTYHNSGNRYPGSFRGPFMVTFECENMSHANRHAHQQHL